MGTWGVGTFENDTAGDWTYGLEETDDLSLVRETFDRVLAAGNSYLDSDIACEGLAACEVIARLKGNWGVRNPYTATIDKWVESHGSVPYDGLVPLATRVIDRVLTSPSELLALWEEGDAAEWKSAVQDLRNRIEA